MTTAEQIVEINDNWNRGFLTCNERKYQLMALADIPWAKDAPNEASILPNCEFDADLHLCVRCGCTEVAHYAKYFYDQLEKTDLHLGHKFLDHENHTNGRWFERNGKTYAAYVGSNMGASLDHISIHCPDEGMSIDLPFFWEGDTGGFYLMAMNCHGMELKLLQPEYYYNTKFDFPPFTEARVDEFITTMVMPIIYDVVDNLKNNICPSNY